MWGPPESGFGQRPREIRTNCSPAIVDRSVKGANATVTNVSTATAPSHSVPFSLCVRLQLSKPLQVVAKMLHSMWRAVYLSQF